MDRIVEFLTRENGLAEHTSREADVAVVLRCVRDDIVMAWQRGELRGIPDVEVWLNRRIDALLADAPLDARFTITGDTTEGGSDES